MFLFFKQFIIHVLVHGKPQIVLRCTYLIPTEYLWHARLALLILFIFRGRPGQDSTPLQGYKNYKIKHDTDEGQLKIWHNKNTGTTNT